MRWAFVVGRLWLFDRGGYFHDRYLSSRQVLCSRQLVGGGGKVLLELLMLLVVMVVVVVVEL